MKNLQSQKLAFLIILQFRSFSIVKIKRTIKDICKYVLPLTGPFYGTSIGCLHKVLKPYKNFRNQPFTLALFSVIMTINNFKEAEDHDGKRNNEVYSPLRR